MFNAVWAAVVIINGMPHGAVTVEENTPSKTLAACEASIEAHRDRVPDWIRGVLQLGWQAEIKGVVGKCVPVGTPA